MIFDRTKNDVEAAIRIREEKIKKFQELTSSEIQTLEKGFMTVVTVNRIAAKQYELKELFNAMGYWNTPIENKFWYNTQIFDASDFERIINNTKVLREAFFVYSNTPKTPYPSYYFEDINALEKILYDLEIMIEDVKNCYRECGNFECGEDN